MSSDDLDAHVIFSPGGFDDVLESLASGYELVDLIRFDIC